ncbi:E3 ubiquitin-protein ligase RNF31 isoform X2 [Struthio camelus]|uniref:E3 ubiquitin-protein ligase RNF31 isoform X2 n=1 Tax=Struthio camelus TaxID=8801 RepID=UPI003604250C
MAEPPEAEPGRRTPPAPEGPDPPPEEPDPPPTPPGGPDLPPTPPGGPDPPPAAPAGAPEAGFEALRAALEAALIRNPGEPVPGALGPALAAPLPPPAKCRHLDGARLLRDNLGQAPGSPGGAPGGARALCTALNILEKYGRNLLQPRPPRYWRAVKFNNPVFRSTVGAIQGGRAVLRLYGYTEETGDGLSFAAGAAAPHGPRVAAVTADVLLLRAELDLLLANKHPNPQFFTPFLEGRPEGPLAPDSAPEGAAPGAPPGAAGGCGLCGVPGEPARAPCPACRLLAPSSPPPPARRPPWVCGGCGGANGGLAVLCGACERPRGCPGPPPAPGADPPPPPAAPRGAWACASCTFLNAAATVLCGVCERPRLAGRPPAPPRGWQCSHCTYWNEGPGRVCELGVRRLRLGPAPPPDAVADVVRVHHLPRVLPAALHHRREGEAHHGARVPGLRRPRPQRRGRHARLLLHPRHPAARVPGRPDLRPLLPEADGARAHARPQVPLVHPVLLRLHLRGGAGPGPVSPVPAALLPPLPAPPCPRCGLWYALARGGCMHFQCSQCRHHFCSGCSRPFYAKNSCPEASCPLRGSLHGHHPRDCLFYLRDWDPPRLQRLLQESGVAFDTEPPAGARPPPGGGCGVLEQKETPGGLRDEPCGKEAPPGHAGLCVGHYKEYLVRLVNERRLDPARLYSLPELRAAAERHLPAGPPPRAAAEPDAAYRRRLLQCLAQEAPLGPAAAPPRRPQ